jgi:hypothetical protein
MDKRKPITGRNVCCRGIEQCLGIRYCLGSERNLCLEILGSYIEKFNLFRDFFLLMCSYNANALNGTWDLSIHFRYAAIPASGFDNVEGTHPFNKVEIQILPL